MRDFHTAIRKKIKLRYPIGISSILNDHEGDITEHGNTEQNRIFKKMREDKHDHQKLYTWAEAFEDTLD